MVDPGDTSDQPLTTSRALCVVLSTRGLEVPVLGRFDPVPLDRAHLTLLLRLARPAGADPADAVGEVCEVDGSTGPDELSAFVRRLADERLLVPAPTAPVVAAGPPPAPPAPPTTGGARADDLLVTASTLVFAATPHGYELHRHHGGVDGVFTPEEVDALVDLVTPVAADELGPRHLERRGADALTAAHLDQLVDRLVARGWVWRGRPSDPLMVAYRGNAARYAEAMVETLRLRGRIHERMVEHDRLEAERTARTGVRRTRVTPITFNGATPPLALGLIMANAMAHDGGRLQEHYDFRPHWMVNPDHPDLLLDGRPGVFLFSNYLWSSAECLALSAAIKERSRHSVTIHGGPDTPKYQVDVEAYFREHPHVDVTVRGEGEATATAVLDALAGRLGPHPTDLSVLRDVAGISFRLGDEIVHTPDRDRIADLDSIPSPYLTGLFEDYAGTPNIQAIFETNRGCPYGCTFCDWGSATNSRIRKFSLDRVMAELEWCATRKIAGYGPADANFGIFDRDVEIAQRVADLKAVHGYPLTFGANYAKNTIKHTQKIITILVDAGVLTMGTISLQSMDPATLAAISRSNIKLEKYEALATAFREEGLPLLVELMMGLPGQTPASFREDLQECLSREVSARIPITELLVNSPMNAPDYLAEHAIRIEQLSASRNKLVVSTTSFTRREYQEMGEIRRLFLMAENFAVLRHVARFVHQETGRREIDLYEDLRRLAHEETERWPTLSLLALAVPGFMAPPVTWQRAIDELRAYLVEVAAVRAGSALDTTLTVQHALLPAADRTMPAVLELPHDYVAWHRAMVDAKNRGHRTDWPAHTPPLATFGPGTMRIEDPHHLCTRGLGLDLESHGFGVNWELNSPVHRSMRATEIEDAVDADFLAQHSAS